MTYMQHRRVAAATEVLPPPAATAVRGARDRQRSRRHPGYYLFGPNGKPGYVNSGVSRSTHHADRRPNQRDHVTRGRPYA